MSKIQDILEEYLNDLHKEDLEELRICLEDDVYNIFDIEDCLRLYVEDTSKVEKVALAIAYSLGISNFR